MATLADRLLIISAPVGASCKSRTVRAGRERRPHRAGGALSRRARFWSEMAASITAFDRILRRHRSRHGKGRQTDEAPWHQIHRARSLLDFEADIHVDERAQTSDKRRPVEVGLNQPSSNAPITGDASAKRLELLRLIRAFRTRPPVMETAVALLVSRAVANSIPDLSMITEVIRRPSPIVAIRAASRGFEDAFGGSLEHGLILPFRTSPVDGLGGNAIGGRYGPYDRSSPDHDILGQDNPQAEPRFAEASACQGRRYAVHAHRHRRRTARGPAVSCHCRRRLGHRNRRSRLHHVG